MGPDPVIVIVPAFAMFDPLLMLLAVMLLIIGHELSEVL
jgi:hypothetical protein